MRPFDLRICHRATLAALFAAGCSPSKSPSEAPKLVAASAVPREAPTVELSPTDLDTHVVIPLRHDVIEKLPGEWRSTDDDNTTLTVTSSWWRESGANTPAQWRVFQGRNRPGDALTCPAKYTWLFLEVRSPSGDRCYKVEKIEDETFEIIDARTGHVRHFQRPK